MLTALVTRFCSTSMSNDMLESDGGEEIFLENGQIDRKRLAAIVSLPGAG